MGQRSDNSIPYFWSNKLFTWYLSLCGHLDLVYAYSGTPVAISNFCFTFTFTLTNSFLHHFEKTDSRNFKDFIQQEIDQFFSKLQKDDFNIFMS